MTPSKIDLSLLLTFYLLNQGKIQSVEKLNPPLGQERENL